MFHLYINLAYYLPQLYLFFRIKDNFITKRYRPLYTVIYILIACIFPLVGLHPLKGNVLLEFVSTITSYLLPFYLYVFLFVVLYDLFLLINHFLKMISREKRNAFQYRFYSLSGILILSALIVTGGAINLNTIQISRYEIEIPKKESHLDHLRIAFIADAHIQEDYPLSFLDQFITKVNALHADILLCGGDIVEGSQPNGKLTVIESKLRTIRTKYGAYAVLGNHEGYGKHEPDYFFKNSGITLLRDSVVSIDSAFYVAGRYDKQYRDRKTTKELIGETTTNLPLILLDHRPTELQEASLLPVDVQFSGHTHNGQLFPVNLIIHQLYELSWGYKKIRSTHFFVTSGLRLWGPQIKTAGKAEIMLVDVKFKD